MTALQVVQKFFPEVKQVKDATRNLTIEVTKRDASSKAVRNHKECALAVACKRSEKMDGCVIAIKRGYLVKDNVAYRYDIPETVSREVVAFDRNAGFAPGLYRLNKPAKKLGSPATGKKHGGESTNGNDRKLRHFTDGIRRIEG